MSTALPTWMWRDPAKVVERLELDALGCELCRSASKTLGRSYCGEARNESQRGFPTIGHRCRWFDERD